MGSLNVASIAASPGSTSDVPLGGTVRITTGGTALPKSVSARPGVAFRGSGAGETCWSWASVRSVTAGCRSKFMMTAAAPPEIEGRFVKTVS